MPKIYAREIKDTVAELCIQANTVLRRDVYKALASALAREKNSRARKLLQALLENADCARRFNLAICQDTGLPYVFVELGQKVLIAGGDLLTAINKGIEQGYKKGGLRNSIIAHPLKRKLKPGFSGGVVHIDVVKGGHINLTVLPKGFGSENKSALKMFNPTEGLDKIKDFIVSSVKLAGPDGCPPFIVGVGIGGGADQAALLAKRALLRPIDRKSPDRILAHLEKELFEQINRLGIGPLGLGGAATCLGVNVVSCPTHIAGLAVGVNISCHALRSATRRL